MQQHIPAEFEYLWLKDADLLPCKGCLSCFTNGEDKCPNRDDAPLIMQKMQEADAVIFASPVYGMNVSGQMKTFIDRFSYVFHRPRFFDKKAFLLVTTGIIGHEDVLKYLDTVARIWGFEAAGRVGLVTAAPLPRHQIEENQRAIGKAAGEFASALQRPGRKRPGLYDVMIFHGQRAAFSQLEKISPADYHYWKGNGWLDRTARYFVDVPVNPLYHAIGTVVEWITARQIRKDMQQEPGGTS
jgi:NAD(P)H-dependent FMN reductase